MGFDVDIVKQLGGPRGGFTLRVRLQTDARRTALYGPSGAGKSLTLQALAGLLKPDRGHIAFGGQTLFDSSAGIDVPARRRGFGFLFQDHALFPHLDVRQNIAFGLCKGWRNPRQGALDAQGEAAVAHWLDALDLKAVARQRPAELSGGQRQRTALARALVAAPRALLLDEPFSALDPALRERTRQALDALLARIDIPVLMITHDPADLARFGDALLQLRGGSIVSGAAVGSMPFPVKLDLTPDAA